jgi:hypothetical protein
MSLACAGTAGGAEKLRTYRDTDFGFIFLYPASWSEQPGIGRNTRVAITAPSDAGNPDATCNILVRRVPSTLNRTQEQLNRGLDDKEFDRDYWLRDMPPNTRVFDSRRIFLGPHAARTAVVDSAMRMQGYTGTQHSFI